MTMTVQPGLFDSEPFRVDVAGKANKPTFERVPVSGIRWRRTGLKRDCFACWQRQAREYDPDKPLYTVRQPAVAELQIWDDDGQLSHHELYCQAHAARLGWDGSRSYDRRKRRDIEAEAKTALAFKLGQLVKAAKPGGYPASFDEDVSSLIRKTGGAKLDMPEWTVTSSGLLVGYFTSWIRESVQDWADQWGSEVESEQITRWESLISCRCRIIDTPPVTVRVCGYTGAA